MEQLCFPWQDVPGSRRLQFHGRTAPPSIPVARGPQNRGVWDKKHNTQRELYRIPDALCTSVAMHVNLGIGDAGVGG
jgi:hypothetical protein